jgi:phosphohistidine phosphatase
MIIYLLRHAIAIERGTPGYPNDDRPLTEAGIDKMKKGAKGILRCIDRPDVILTSPLKRALDTAKILAAELNAPGLVKTTDALLPAASPKQLYDDMAKHKNAETIVMVGHSPDLERIAANLLGTPQRLLEFKKGGIGAIELDALPPKRPGRLLWLLTAKQSRAIA